MTTNSGPRPDEGKTTRIITIEANAKSLEKQRKEGNADGFTMYSDESKRLGGDNSAPSPMRYMALSVAF